MIAKILYWVNVLLIVGIFFFGSCAYSQTKTGYTIEGRIEGLPKNITLYLITTKEIDKADTVSIVKSTAGKFVFHTHRIILGKMYFVKVDVKEFKPQGKAWFRLVIDSLKTNISGIASQWPEVTITGSSSTIVYEDYQKYNNIYAQQLSELQEKLIKALPKDTKWGNFDFEDILNHPPNDTSSLGLTARQVYKEWRKFVLGFVRDNINSLVVSLLIKDSKALTLNEKEAAYDALTPKVKGSYYGKDLLTFIRQEKHNKEIEKKRAELVAGKRIPDFKISGLDGRQTSVLDIASKSDYTLIDFWASWCAPCRAAIPKLKEVYQAYHTKGFNILAISTDKSEIAWKKALAQENTKWDNGWDNIDRAEKNIFGMSAIPGYILLDKKGTIVQTDYFSMGGGFRIVRSDEKTLSGNLAEIIAELLEENNKSK